MTADFCRKKTILHTSGLSPTTTPIPLKGAGLLSSKLTESHIYFSPMAKPWVDCKHMRTQNLVYQVTQRFLKSSIKARETIILK